MHSPRGSSELRAMIHGFLAFQEAPISDDEDDDRPDVDFIFRGHPEDSATLAPANCRALIVCAPGAASSFVKGAFPLRRVAWQFETKGEPVRLIPTPPKTPSFFIIDGAKEGSGAEAVVFALLDGFVAPELATAWVETLLESFPSASDVFYLDHIFRNDYRRNADNKERPQEPHLCGLWTHARDKAKVEAIAPLPGPNTVEGTAAALLTQCEATRKRCLVALALQDGAHMGAGCLKAFEQLQAVFSGIGLMSEGWRGPDYDDVLRKTVHPPAMSIYA